MSEKKKILFKGLKIVFHVQITFESNKCMKKILCKLKNPRPSNTYGNMENNTKIQEGRAFGLKAISKIPEPCRWGGVKGRPSVYRYKGSGSLWPSVEYIASFD